jgi:hypothetical protein
MSRSNRQNKNRDITDFVSEEMWSLAEPYGNKIVNILQDNGYDFCKSRALRILSSTNSNSNASSSE